MTREQILDKVRSVLVDALAVDDADVTPGASLTRDLGAESIDFLDIQFKLEQAFGFKIAQGEMFPDDLMKNPDIVKEGKLTPDGKVITDEQWIKNRDKWLPSKDDGDYIQSLMKPQWDRGKFASWITAPKIGIDNKAGDFEYVRIHG